MIKVVLKALKVLEIVSAAGNEPVRLSELARQLDELPSTLAGIVKTLTEAGYLKKNQLRGCQLGIMATTLTHGDLYQRNLLLAAEKTVPEFAQEHGLFVSLSIIRNNVRHTIMEANEAGQTLMLGRANAAVTSSATGLIVLSYEPRHKQEEILSYYGLPRPFTTYEDYMSYLERIRQQGYVEVVRPINRLAIGVPVWYKDQVIAGFGSFLTESQRQNLEIKKIVLLLKEMARKTSTKLEELESQTD